MHNLFSIHNSQKILGLDYGKKRIGLAITDPDRTMVFLRDALQVKSEKQVFEYLKNFCQAEQISLIIIGLPYLLDMRETNQTKEIKNFGEKLRKITNLQIEYVDETLSSFESDEILENFPKDKIKKSSGLKDSLSAKIILERWMGKF